MAGDSHQCMGTEKHCAPLHSTVQRTLCHPLCFYRAFRYCALFVKSGLGCKMDFIVVITDYMKIKTTVQCALSFSMSHAFFVPLSQSIIPSRALTVGATAWRASAIAASVAAVTSSARTASGVATPAARTATSIRWRSTLPGWVTEQLLIHHSRGLSLCGGASGLICSTTGTLFFTSFHYRTKANEWKQVIIHVMVPFLAHCKSNNK